MTLRVLFIGGTGIISSASAYQTPPANLPVTESTPLDSPFWTYSQAKIACEERLMKAYRPVCSNSKSKACLLCDKRIV